MSPKIHDHLLMNSTITKGYINWRAVCSKLFWVPEMYSVHSVWKNNAFETLFTFVQHEGYESHSLPIVNWLRIKSLSTLLNHAQYLWDGGVSVEIIILAGVLTPIPWFRFTWYVGCEVRRIIARCVSVKVVLQAACLGVLGPGLAKWELTHMSYSFNIFIAFFKNQSSCTGFQFISKARVKNAIRRLSLHNYKIWKREML